MVKHVANMYKRVCFNTIALNLGITNYTDFLREIIRLKTTFRQLKTGLTIYTLK